MNTCSAEPAIQAFDALDEQEMYAGCNFVRLGFSNLTDITVKANSDRSWDYRGSGMPPPQG